MTVPTNGTMEESRVGALPANNYINYAYEATTNAIHHHQAIGRNCKLLGCLATCYCFVQSWSPLMTLVDNQTQSPGWYCGTSLQCQSVKHSGFQLIS